MSGSWVWGITSPWGQLTPASTRRQGSEKGVGGVGGYKEPKSKCCFLGLLKERSSDRQSKDPAAVSPGAVLEGGPWLNGGG